MKDPVSKLKSSRWSLFTNERGITLLMKFFAMVISLSYFFYMLIAICHHFKIMNADYMELLGIPAICLWAYLECFYPGGYHWRSNMEKRFDEQREMIGTLLDRIGELVEVNESYQQVIERMEAEKGSGEAPTQV